MENIKYGNKKNRYTHSNALDFELAKSVGEYFQLNNMEMDKIIGEIITATKTWKTEAKSIGISHAEMEMMEPAFMAK